MNPSAFEARLHAALDQRRDPLDDPQLVAWLEQHPEQLAAFAALRADLRALAAGPARAHRPRRRRSTVRTGVAAAAAAGVLFAWALGRSSPHPRVPTAASPGRVLSAHLACERPRLYAGVDFTVRESSTCSPTLRFERYSVHHLAR